MLKKYRTIQQIKTIEDAIQTVHYLNKQGEGGKIVVRDLVRDFLYNNIKESRENQKAREGMIDEYQQPREGMTDEYQKPREGVTIDEYQKAREGVTIDQIFKDLADSLDKVKEKKSIDEKIIGGEIYALFQMLQDDKLELTDEQNKLIKEIIIYGFSYHCWNLSNFKVWLGNDVGNSIGERNMSINFLCANFKRFSQQDREEIISEIKDKVHKGQKVELYEEKSDSLGFYPNKCRFDLCYSFYTKKLHGKAGIDSNIIQPLIVETLQNSTNEKLIFEMFWYLDRYSKDKIPQNCITEYSDMEKLKKYITPKILESYGYTTNKAFEILNNLGLNITWDVAEQWSKRVNKGYFDVSKHPAEYVDKTYIVNRLSERIIQKDSVKQALNSIIENCSKEDLEKFKQYFSSKYIWGLLDDKYKEPKFVNKHIDVLKPILDEDGLNALLQQFKKSTEGKELSDSEKFHRDVFNYLSIEWEYVDLTTIKVEDFGNVKKGLYDYVKNKGLLGTDYLDGILKRHGYPKTHIAYFMCRAKGDVPKDFLKGVLDNNTYYNEILSSEEATAFMQDVYATQDENLVKELFYNIGEFSKYCTQREVNILTGKMIKAISSKEDFQKFYNMIESYAYSEKFGIFLDIKYLLTGSLDRYKLREHKTEIPSNIYASLILSKIINITDLPKVGPSVFVNSDDLMKLSGYYAGMIEDEKKAEEEARQAKQEREKRIKEEEEETQRIYDEAVKNREKGEVIFDFYERDAIYGGQKFILSVDRTKRILVFATDSSETFPFHANLQEKYIKDGRCLGGGLLHKNDEAKTITLGGHSESYGSVSGQDREAMKKMLEKKFPDYKIIM